MASMYGADATQLSGPQGAGANVVAPVQERVAPSAVPSLTQFLGGALNAGLAANAAAQQDESKAFVVGHINTHREAIQKIQQAFDSGQIKKSEYDLMKQNALIKVPTEIMISEDWARYVRNFSQDGLGAAAQLQQDITRKNQESVIAEAKKVGIDLVGQPANSPIFQNVSKALDTRARATEELRVMGETSQAQNYTDEAKSRLITAELFGANKELYVATFETVQEDLKSGKIDNQTAVLTLNSALGPLKKLHSDTLMLGGKNQAAALASVISDSEKDIELFASGKLSLEMVKQKNELIVASMQNNLLEGVDGYSAVVAMGQVSTFYPLEGLVLGKKIVDYLVGARASQATLEEGRASEEEALAKVKPFVGVDRDVEKVAITNLKHVAAKFKTLDENAQKIVSHDLKIYLNQLENAARNSRIKSEDLYQTADFLASPEFKMFIDNGVVSDAARSTAQTAVDRVMGNYVAQYSAEKFSEVLSFGGTDKKYQIGQLVDIEYRNGKFVFVAPTLQELSEMGITDIIDTGFGIAPSRNSNIIEDAVYKLNSETGRALNAVIAIQANITGQSKTDYWNNGGAADTFPQFYADKDENGATVNRTTNKHFAAKTRSVKRPATK